MIWGGSGAEEATPLAFIEGRQDAKSYIEPLKLNMKPYGEAIYSDSWYSQQDSSSSHAAELTKTCFQDEGIHVIDWSARSLT